MLLICGFCVAIAYYFATTGVVVGLQLSHLLLLDGLLQMTGGQPLHMVYHYVIGVCRVVNFNYSLDFTLILTIVLELLNAIAQII